jgi:hypothetical protein
MLFDLRSRKRRGAVRVVYLGLALVMVAGLVLVGVGTGSNSGGLLNAFTNGSSNSGQNDAVTAQIKSSLAATKKTPNSAAAWGKLLEARFAAAGTGSDYNSVTDVYTAAGKKQLGFAANDWTRYLALSKNKPEQTYAILAAEIYQHLENWSAASSAWQYTVTSNSQSALKPYLCLALNSYAAKQTAQGQLAATKAVKLAPKLQQLELKETLESAKSSATTAQETVLEEC